MVGPREEDGKLTVPYGDAAEALAVQLTGDLAAGPLVVPAVARRPPPVGDAVAPVAGDGLSVRRDVADNEPGRVPLRLLRDVRAPAAPAVSVVSQLHHRDALPPLVGS